MLNNPLGIKNNLFEVENNLFAVEIILFGFDPHFTVISIERRTARKMTSHSALEMLSATDTQLDRLRQIHGAVIGMDDRGLTSEYNPCYDFGSTKCSLQDLRVINRNHLTLVRYSTIT